MILDSYFQDRRTGVLKFWGDFPVRIEPADLEDLRDAVDAATAGFGGVKFTIADRVYNSLDDALTSPRLGKARYVKVDSIAGVIHLGPQSVYVYTRSDDERTRALMHRIQEILWKARRRPATLVLRWWVWATAVAVTVAIGGTFWPTGGRVGAVMVAGGVAGAGLAVAAAFYVGIVGRVRLDLSGNSTWFSRNGDALLVAVLVLILGAVVNWVGDVVGGDRASPTNP